MPDNEPYVNLDLDALERRAVEALRRTYPYLDPESPHMIDRVAASSAQRGIEAMRLAVAEAVRDAR
jgi:hypothetical protein